MAKPTRSSIFPVFIFYVPDNRSNDNNPYYIYSVLDFLKNRQSYIEIKNKDDLETGFFGENGFLIENYFEWSLSKGNIVPIPTIKKTSERKFFAGKMHLPEYRWKISKTLHDALWRFCEDLLLEIYDHKRMSLREGKSRIDLLKIEAYMQTLEVLLKKYESSDVSRVTVCLWYSANEGYKKAYRWIRKAIKITKENIKKTKDKDAQQHLKENLRGYKNHYLKIIKSRMG